MAKYRIYVLVRDQQGAPVPKVHVQISRYSRMVPTVWPTPVPYNTNIAEGYTDSNGEFASPPLKPGWYNIILTGNGITGSLQKQVEITNQDVMPTIYLKALPSIPPFSKPIPYVPPVPSPKYKPYVPPVPSPKYKPPVPSPIPKPYIPQPQMLQEGERGTTYKAGSSIKHRIHVIVYDANGRPVPGALINIATTTRMSPAPPSVGVNWGYTNNLGEFISLPLDSGRYRISIQIKAGGPVEQSVVQLTDRDVTVPIRFKPIPPGLVTQPYQSTGTTQTGALTFGKSFWWGLAIGGAVLYLLLRR